MPDDPPFPGGHLVPPLYPAAVYPYPDLDTLDRAMAAHRRESFTRTMRIPTATNSGRNWPHSKAGSGAA